MHLVLGDYRSVLGILSRLGFTLDGQIVSQGLAGDDHRGRVNAILTA